MRAAAPTILAAWIALASPAAAQIVVYALDGANAKKAATIAPTRQADGVEASPLVAVGTSQPLDYARTLSYASWPTAGSGIDRSQYYELTVTPVEGRTITYRSLSFSVASGGHGSPRIAVHGSTDGFAESDVALASFSYTANTTVQTFKDVDISKLGEQAGPVTIRIYLEKGSSGFAGLLDTDAFGGGTSVIVE